MFKNLFKRNTYHLYECDNLACEKYIRTYKRRKINDALIDHIASIVPDINENTLQIIHRDDECVLYRFLLNGEAKTYSLEVE